MYSYMLLFAVQYLEEKKKREREREKKNEREQIIVVKIRPSSFSLLLFFPEIIIGYIVPTAVVVVV